MRSSVILAIGIVCIGRAILGRAWIPPLDGVTLHDQKFAVARL